MNVNMSMELNGKTNTAEKYRLFFVTVLLVCAALSFHAVPYAYLKVHAASATSSTVKSIESKIESIETKIENLETQMSQTSADLKDAINQKAYYDTKLSLVNESIEEANNLIGAYAGQIAAKEAEIAAKEAEIQNKYAEFESWIKVTYENGSSTYLAMLFDSENFTDFMSGAEQVANIIEYQNNLMTDLDQELTALDSEKAQLNTLKSEKEDAQEKLQQQELTYSNLSRESQDYISSLKSDRASLEKAYEKAQQEQEALNKALEEELAKLAKQNTVYVGGTFMWPVDAKFSRISSGFGYRGNEYHIALDIPANYGTNVYAANGGKVVKAERHNSYGNYVLIDHGGGQATLYAHNSKLLVSVGDTVNKGDIIALVGSTGYSTGNHLHFEVRINGVAQNPLNYVSPPQ